MQFLFGFWVYELISQLGEKWCLKSIFFSLCCFDSSPTTLDAVVFAHLAVIWKAPLPNNKLHNYLQGYDNLTMFCGRILQRYLQPEIEG